MNKNICIHRLVEKYGNTEIMNADRMISRDKIHDACEASSYRVECFSNIGSISWSSESPIAQNERGFNIFHPVPSAPVGDVSGLVAKEARGKSKGFMRFVWQFSERL